MTVLLSIMSNTNLKKRIVSYISVLVLIFLFYIFVSYVYTHINKIDSYNELSTYIEDNPHLHIHEEKVESEFDYFSTSYLKDIKESFDGSVSVNNDLKGIIAFSSKLLNKPVLQGSSNEYKNIDWISGSYSDFGSIYLDYRNGLEDKNMVIYGRYLSEKESDNRNLLFTQLDDLKEETNYKDNDVLCFYTSYSIVYYRVVSVYKDFKEDYYYDGIDEASFNEYKNKIRENEYYHVDIDYDYNNNFLTLVVENNDEVVLCKEIGREYHE